MSLHHVLEMSISREEFFRFLPAAVGAFEVEGDTIRSSSADAGWTIRLVPLAERRIGSVLVPRFRVEIDLATGLQPEGEAFMDRFHRAFLRGGG